MTEPARRPSGGKVVPLYPRDPAPSRGDSLASNRSDLYKFAAERAIATLKSQQEELTGTRTRAVQVMAYIGAATTFLVGTALSGLGREPEIRGHVLYQVGLGTACTMAFLAVLLLLSLLTGVPGRLRPYESATGVRSKPEPKLQFMFDLRGDMLADWVVDEQHQEARRPEEFYEFVTRQGRKMELYNTVHLAAVRFRFRLFIVAILVQLTAWVVLALRYG